MLEYSYVSTMHLFYHHFMCYRHFGLKLTRPTDSVPSRILKKNLVKMLDKNMWPDIITLRVVACWLDPTLKTFSFIENIPDHTALLKQAEDVVTSHCIATVSELYSQESVDVETPVEASNETDEDFHSDSIEKR